MARLLGVLMLAGLCACPEMVIPPPPPTPPAVFLTIAEPNVIGDSIKGKVNVSGCKNVAQVQLLQGEAFLFDVNYSKSPTDFVLPAGLFSALYSRLGIAASLTLKARVVCDDGRTNNSQPVGVTFFPIAAKYTEPSGGQLVPNNFVAEGGLGGTSNTFLGCVVISTGTTIARVNTRGEVVGQVSNMPFDCSLATEISERSQVTGTRWVMEPGRGVFAIDNALTVKRVFNNNGTKRIGVGAKGSAAVWTYLAGTNRLHKLDPTPGSTNEWVFPSGPGMAVQLSGIMNSTPVVDDGSGSSVWVTDWRFISGSGVRQGEIVPLKLDLNTGVLLNGVVSGQPAVMFTQQYPLSEVSMPIIPEGVFSADGAFFTVPLLSDDGMGNLRTTVVSCSTVGGNCEGNARRWTSPTFFGMLRLVVPFSQGNIYAAVGPYQVYFLSGQLGTVMNLGEVPLQPTGSLQVVGVQPGLGSDFYVLTGPNLGANPSYPMEIIATDLPQSGELWRMQWGSGESSANGMYMGLDDSGQVWIRTGLELVKPLPNREYRTARGPTTLP